MMTIPTSDATTRTRVTVTLAITALVDRVLGPIQASDQHPTLGMSASLWRLEHRHLSLTEHRHFAPTATGRAGQASHAGVPVSVRLPGRLRVRHGGAEDPW